MVGACVGNAAGVGGVQLPQDAQGLGQRLRLGGCGEAGRGPHCRVIFVVKFPHEFGHSILMLRGCGLVRAAVVFPGV